MSDTAVARPRRGVSLRAALGTVLVIVAVVVGGFLIWAMTPLGPSDAAREALVSDARVQVTETRDAWVFVPSQQEGNGLILYPGGRVDVRSYSTLARRIAQDGTSVVVLKVPLSLAVLEPGAARAAFDEPLVSGVKRWAVGGHSLGGVMAASFAHDNPDRIEGLLLLASYPMDADDLNRSTLAVTDLTGSRDGVLNRDDWRAARSLMPADTRYFEIAGGNHAQFGDYGPQPGDNTATISAEQQHEAIAEETVRLFERIGGAQ